MLSGLRQCWLASSRQITWAISFFSYIENILNTRNKCGPACTFMHQWFFFSKVLYDGFQSRGLQKYQTRSQNLPIFCPHYLRILVTFRNFAILWSRLSIAIISQRGIIHGLSRTGSAEAHISNMFLVVVISLIICDVVFAGKKMLICGFLKKYF